MEEQTLTPEQIAAWRRVIHNVLENKMQGTGIYALIMPESEVIAFWQASKQMFEKPKPVMIETRREIKPAKCTHSNSITGNRGKYCLDCEEYVD